MKSSIKSLSKEIIVDTSALIAFFVRSELHHQAAQQYVLKYPNHRWIILESVLAETVTWIRFHVSPQASIIVGQVLRQEHRYLSFSEEDDIAIWEAFCQYDLKPWSYTDCSILVMSQKLGVYRIFAFDDRLRQMAGLGIICVP